MLNARPFFSAAPSVSAGCSLTSPVLFPAVPAVAAARARPLSGRPLPLIPLSPPEGPASASSFLRANPLSPPALMYNI